MWITGLYTARLWFILYDMSKVLVAEDDTLLASLLVEQLKKEGYETRAAFDGMATVDEVKKWHPDVLLLDILMPGKNGWEVLEAIRADGTTAATPVVIIVSNLSAQDDMDKAQQMGVKYFLVKATTSLTEIVAKVKGVLG